MPFVAHFPDAQSVKDNWNMSQPARNPDNGMYQLTFTSKTDGSNTKTVQTVTPGDTPMDGFQGGVTSWDGVNVTLDAASKLVTISKPSEDGSVNFTLQFVNEQLVFPAPQVSQFQITGDEGSCRCVTPCAWNPATQTSACYVQSRVCKATDGEIKPSVSQDGVLSCALVPREQQLKSNAQISFVKTASRVKNESNTMFTIDAFYNANGTLVQGAAAAAMGLGPEGRRFFQVEAPDYVKASEDKGNGAFNPYFNRRASNGPIPGVPAHEVAAARFIAAAYPLSEFVREFFAFVQLEKSSEAPKASGNSPMFYYVPESWDRPGVRCPYALCENGRTVDVYTTMVAMEKETNVGTPENWFPAKDDSGVSYETLIAPHEGRCIATQLIAGKRLRGTPIFKSTLRSNGGSLRLVRSQYVAADGSTMTGNLVTPVYVTGTMLAGKASKVRPNPLTDNAGQLSTLMAYRLPPLLRRFTVTSDEKVQTDTGDVFQVTGGLRHFTSTDTVQDSANMARRLKKIVMDKATADAVNAEMENTQEQGYAWLLSRLLTIVSPTTDKVAVYANNQPSFFGTESPVPKHSDGSVDMFKLAYALNTYAKDSAVAQQTRTMTPYDSRTIERYAPWTVVSIPGIRVVQSFSSVGGEIRGFHGCASAEDQIVPGICGNSGSKFVQGLETDFSNGIVSDSLKSEFCNFYSNGASLISGQGDHVAMLRKQYNGVCPDAMCGSLKDCGACGNAASCVWCRSSKCGIEGKGVCVAKSSECDEAQRGCKPHCGKCPSIDNAAQCLAESDLRHLQDNIWDQSLEVMGHKIPMWVLMTTGCLCMCYCCTRSSPQPQMYR